MEREALAQGQIFDKLVGPDIRGKLVSADARDFIAAMKQDFAGKPAADSKKLLDEEEQRLAWLKDYWLQYPGLTHNKNMWGEFLARNQFPADTSHNAAVADAQKALLKNLADRPTASWAESARALHDAFVRERRDLVRNPPSPLIMPVLRPRTSPCTEPATQTSGKGAPKVGLSARSLIELWPTESRRLAEEGTVIARLHIDTTGCVTSLAIMGSSGSEMMDNAVLLFFEATQFYPAAIDGKAIESTVNVPISFNLTK